MRKLPKNRFVLFDGALGTMLQSAGLKAGALPELCNIENPDLVLGIHKMYVEAGCDIISANTFGANSLKLKDSGYAVDEVVKAGLLLAKKSGARYVALDVGPIGVMLRPSGTLKFEEAYGIYKEIFLAAKELADLILIETMSDLYEMKAAILAAKETCALPVFCSVTFQKDLKTFSGSDALTALLTIQALGADAVGVNCSHNPEGLKPVVDTFLEYSKIPVIVQPNAGLPLSVGDKAFYDVDAERFSEIMAGYAKSGAAYLGGCCGTTPEYIGLLKEKLSGVPFVKRKPKAVTAVTSPTKTVIIESGVTVIGERLNPTGKKLLKEALKNSDFDYVLGEAISQMRAGADILDVNCGLPDIDEGKTLVSVIEEIQSVVNLPLQIDSADADAIEKAARIYNGKPLINSVSGKADSMKKIFPLVKKYGTAVIGLTLDENGIPLTAKERFKIAERIVKTAKEYGISKDDIIIDCLVLTASAQQEYVLETLKAVSLVKEKLGVKTVLGVSNVSFGLPNRDLLNSTFLTAALSQGLDAAIMNPLSERMTGALVAFRVLYNMDKNAESFIKNAEKAGVAETSVSQENSDLSTAVSDGRVSLAEKLTKELLKTSAPLDIIDNYFVPALDKAGAEFENGKLFLPKLMKIAETVKACFDIIKTVSGTYGNESKGKIILATVKGDIHDIGKNIAKMLLMNYGYRVIDLGKDVDAETIISCAKAENVSLIGLSALMTTTVNSMKSIISEIRAAGLSCKIMVGGAVLNEEYARYTGADFYAQNAQEGVHIAQALFRPNVTQISFKI